MENEEKEYTIESFADLCNTITMENRGRLLKDMVSAFMGYAEAIEGVKKAHPEIASINNWDVCQFGFKWYDDGKNEFRGAVVETDNSIFTIGKK